MLKPVPMWDVAFSICLKRALLVASQLLDRAVYWSEWRASFLVAMTHTCFVTLTRHPSWVTTEGIQHLLPLRSPKDGAEEMGAMETKGKYL